MKTLRLLTLFLLPALLSAQTNIPLQKVSGTNVLTSTTNPLVVGNGQTLTVASGGTLNVNGTLNVGGTSNIVTTAGSYANPAWITSYDWSKLINKPTIGTVSSVGLTLPSIFSVTNSPVTSSGTLAVTFATGQTANQVLASPNGSTGAVALRSLVAADIPTLTLSKISDAGTAATKAVAFFQTPQTTAAGYGITNGVTIDQWGTKTPPTTNVFASTAANKVLATPDGAAGAPVIRSLVAADIPPLTLSQFPQITAGTIIGNALGEASIPQALTPAGVKSLLAISVTDLTDAGNAALLNVGVTAGTVAAGNDPRFNQPLYSALGQLAYGGAGGAPALLNGNTSTTRKFLTQTGDGTGSAAPQWTTIPPFATTPTANALVETGSDGKIDVGFIPADQLQIQFRHGTDSERQSVIFAVGEPVYCTDTKRMWLGDGTTLGGISEFALPPQSGHSGQVLTTDGSISSWSSSFVPAGYSVIYDGSDLQSVNISVGGVPSTFSVDGLSLQGGLAATNDIYSSTNVSAPVIQGVNYVETIRLLMDSTASNQRGIQAYNTVDQTTNYERAELLWSSNVYNFRTVKGGTGTARDLAFSTPSGASVTLSGSAPTVTVDSGVTLSTGYSNGLFNVGGMTMTNTTGPSQIVAITPTYNQSSGTSENSDLFINRTETAVGSGEQNLIRAQVGGTDKFKVSNKGVITAISISQDTVAPQVLGGIPKDCGVSDGATTGRGVRQFPATALSGGLPIVLAGTLPDVQTSLGNAYVWGTSTSAMSTPGLANYGIHIRYTSAGELIIRQEGATAETDYRQMYYAGFRTAYLGSRNLTYSIEWSNGDTTTNPTITIGNIDVTSLFTMSTAGTAPNWWPASLVSTYIQQGFNWPSGRIPMTSTILGTWTSTERANFHTLGILPSWCLVKSGSAISLTSGTLTIGARYRIVTYVAGDSFTNVGAASNASGVEFTATGTTPTTWTNSSALIACGPISRLAWQSIPVLHDLGSNHMEGVCSPGITPVSTSRDWLIVTTTETNGNQQLLGGALFFNTNAHRIDSWVINNSGTSETISLGSASAGTQYLSSGTAAAGNNDVTLVTRFNASTALWCNANGTATLTHTIAGHMLQ